MKKIHYAMMAVIIMAMLGISNAHSGSGGISLGASMSGNPEPKNDSTTVQKEELVVSESDNEPVIITCGEYAEISEGERFQILYNGEAFLDRATCLIWEMYPLQNDLTLPEATAYCGSLEIGNRNDWRVPHLFDLMLLEDSIDGSVKPWDEALQCWNNNYGGVGEYHCAGWTKTPVIGGPAGSYYAITMNHGSLRSLDLNDLAYPFCVSGVVKSGN